MNEMLHRENKGLMSNSVTAQQLLNGEKWISILEVTRLESELGICEHKKSAPNATIAEQPLNERKVSVLETTRLELEHSTNGDHDTPYTFTLPTSMPQTLAWARLLARVHRGELEL